MACQELRDALEMAEQPISVLEGLCDWCGRTRYGLVRGEGVLPMLNGLEGKLLALKDTLLQMQKVSSALEVVARQVAPVFCKLLVDVIDEPETDIIVMATGKGDRPHARVGSIMEVSPNEGWFRVALPWCGQPQPPLH